MTSLDMFERVLSQTRQGGLWSSRQNAKFKGNAGDFHYRFDWNMRF